MRHPWAGLLLVFAVATGFAANSACAAVAYQAGSNPLTVLATRSILAVLFLLAVLRLQGIEARLAPRRRAIAIALGVLMATYSYGLLGAIQYIPVALGVITFYTYPLLVGIGAWLTGRERPSALQALALVVAFGGLYLVLDVPGGGLDPRGIALAMMGAVLVSVLLLLNNRLVGSGDSRPVTLHMLITAAVCYVAATTVLGALALPGTASGWLAFAAVPVFYSFSIVGVFVAMSMIGPVKTSLAMNFEPVASMALGFLLLGQGLAPGQLAGAALVIGAVLLARGRVPPAAERAPASLE